MLKIQVTCRSWQVLVLYIVMDECMVISNCYVSGIGSILCTCVFVYNKKLGPQCTYKSFKNTAHIVHKKFNFRDVMSTYLTILVKKFAATFCYKWSKFRSKNWTHVRMVKFVTRKKFAIMRLRKKVLNFRNYGTVLKFRDF